MCRRSWHRCGQPIELQPKPPSIKFSRLNSEFCISHSLRLYLLPKMVITRNLSQKEIPTIPKSGSDSKHIARVFCATIISRCADISCTIIINNESRPETIAFSREPFRDEDSMGNCASPIGMMFILFSSSHMLLFLTSSREKWFNEPITTTTAQSVSRNWYRQQTTARLSALRPERHHKTMMMMLHVSRESRIEKKSSWRSKVVGMKFSSTLFHSTRNEWK